MPALQAAVLPALHHHRSCNQILNRGQKHRPECDCAWEVEWLSRDKSTGTLPGRVLTHAQSSHFLWSHEIFSTMLVGSEMMMPGADSMRPQGVGYTCGHKRLDRVVHSELPPPRGREEEPSVSTNGWSGSGQGCKGREDRVSS